MGEWRHLLLRKRSVCILRTEMRLVIKFSMSETIQGACPPKKFALSKDIFMLRSVAV